MYVVNTFGLLVTGQINARTFIRTLKKRPFLVAGKNGVIVADQRFAFAKKLLDADPVAVADVKPDYL